MAGIALNALIRTSIQLRVALLRGSLRSGPGSTPRQIGFGIGALFGAGAAFAAFAAQAAGRGHGEFPLDLSTVLFTGMVAGWVVLPILTFTSDDLLDPARLALLPLTGRQLLTVMGVGALIGIAPFATVVAALGLLPATGTGPTSYLVALIAVVLLLALCVSASRAVTSALSGLLRSRRGRDLGVAFAAVVGLSFQLINPLLQVALRSGKHGQDSLHGLGGPLRWTPPGLLAAAPTRPLPAAIGSLLLVAALVAVLLLIWQRTVRRALERTEVSGTRRRRNTSLAPRGLPIPSGRTGAIMAKDLRYLMREPRRLVTTVTGVLLPVLAIVLGPSLLEGGRPPAGLVFAVCGIGLLSGLIGGNRFGLDGTATWMLVSSATDHRDARRDLLGGDLAAMIVTGPILVLLAVLIAAVTGGWSNLPPALGLGFGLYSVGVGISGIVAVNAPYIVPETQNAFGGGGGGRGCTAGILGVAAMLAEAAICLPLFVLLVPALVSGPLWGFVLLGVGPLYGLALGDGLRRVAARRWSSRGPEVLEVLTSGRG